MATVATMFRRTEARMAEAQSQGRESWETGVDVYRLRPLPSEEVYFYSKRVDNSRLVREADPAARRRQWKSLGKGFAAAGLLILLVIPKTLVTVAGYELHGLERERIRLVNEKAVLELEEARLRSPERLEQLARQYNLVNPDPKRVMVLNPKGEGALALNVTK